MTGPALRLAWFYAGYFFAAGVQLPFWPVWLASRGLAPAEIGALLALGQWGRVATSPLAGVLADRAADRRHVMAWLGAAGVASYLLCVPGHGFAMLVVPSVLAAVAVGALLPLGDALALATASQGRAEYGRVRLWGTIAFIVATLLGGQVLARGADGVLYLIIATLAITAVCCWFLPREAAAAPSASPAPWRDFVAARHLVFLAAAALIQSSHAVYYGFGTLYWQGLGIADSTIAWLWAEGAIAEIALFYFGARLARRCGAAGLMAVGGAGAVVRWGATALVTTTPPLIALQPLHALSFAATHLGAMLYLARAVPPGRAAAAQTFYAAITGGVGLGIASLGAGALYGAYGGRAYWAMAVMAGAGAGLAVWLARDAAGDQRPQRR